MRRHWLSLFGRQSKPPPIAELMNLALTQPGLIYLAAGFTDPDTLPIEEVRFIVDDVLSDENCVKSALQYGSTKGLPKLRELTAERLQRVDLGLPPGVADADRVVITHGSQQLLYLLIEALCDPGDVVLVEDPTYFVFLGLLEGRGVKTHGVKLTPDGVDLDHFDYVLRRLVSSGEIKRLKLFYIVTYAHNPTGIVWSFVKKAAVLERLLRIEKLAGHPVFLVEDAAYRDLLFENRHENSALKISDSKARVIYVGTYTKPFATGIRVGFGLLPPQLIDPVLNIKANHDFGTSQFIQYVVCRALESGLYERHLGVLHEHYRAKALVMKDAIEKWFPSYIDVWHPTGGLYYWIRLPRHQCTGPRSKLFRTALRQGVLYVPGCYCYARDPWRKVPNHEMRLSFGSASASEIQKGVKRLGEVIKSISSYHTRRQT